MKETTKAKLKEAQDFCDENDKSTEFMLEYMQDYAGVNLDCVMKYLKTDGGFKEKK
jgi:hypothetical protein